MAISPAEELRGALDLIREEVEQHVPPGTLPSSEMFITATAEAQAIVTAIRAIASRSGQS